MSFSSRSLMVPLLLGVMLSACDKPSAPAGQDGTMTSGEVTSGEVPSATTDKGNDNRRAPAYSISREKAGSPLPDTGFTDEKGKETSLAAFAGKPLLVNLWATWCAPCVAEMPQLDRIAATHAQNGLRVLTISQDAMGADKVMAYWNDKDFRHIQPWLDPENGLGFHYGTGVLPTSVLYGADGKEIARITGALDWEGEEGKTLLAEAVKK